MTTPQLIRRRQRIIIAFQGLTGLIAVAALIISVSINSDAISRLNKQRIDGRAASCELLKDVVLVATPPAKQKLARQFITRTPLHDCSSYANSKAIAFPLPKQLTRRLVK